MYKGTKYFCGKVKGSNKNKLSKIYIQISMRLLSVLSSLEPINKTLKISANELILEIKPLITILSEYSRIISEPPIPTKMLLKFVKKLISGNNIWLRLRKLLLSNFATLSFYIMRSVTCSIFAGIKCNTKDRFLCVKRSFLIYKFVNQKFVFSLNKSYLIRFDNLQLPKVPLDFLVSVYILP